MTKPAISVPNPTCAVCNTEMALRSRFNKRFGRKRYAGSYFRCLQCGQTIGLDVWQQECADRAFLEFISDIPSPPACPSLDDLDFDLDDLFQPAPASPCSSLDDLDFDLDDLFQPAPTSPASALDDLDFSSLDTVDSPEASPRSNVIVLATHPFWISRHRGRC